MATSRNDLEKVMFAVVGKFEGKGYTQVTGNFDGAGLSGGFLQWNLGSRTLQPIILQFAKQYPDTYRKVMGKLADEFLRVVSGPAVAAVAWADKLSTGKSKHGFDATWKAALEKLLGDPNMQAIQRHAAQVYVKDAIEDAKFYGIQTVRGVVLMFNISVQSGPYKAGANSKVPAFGLTFAHLGGHALPYKKKLLALAKAASKTCKPEFEGVVYRRALCIVEGKAEVYKDTVIDAEAMGVTDDKVVL